MSLATHAAAGVPAASPFEEGDGLVDVRIVLGKTTLTLDESARLMRGNTVSLDQAVNDPVEILANGRILAKGVLTVQDGCFWVRVLEVVR
jgi:flagellar motor switch protein FliN/FliY